MGKYTKAIVAMLGVATAMFTAAIGAGSPAGDGITLNEWVSLLVFAALTGGVAWAVPNTPAPPAPYPPAPDALTTVNVNPSPTLPSPYARPRLGGAHEIEDHT